MTLITFMFYDSHIYIDFIGFVNVIFCKKFLATGGQFIVVCIKSMLKFLKLRNDPP